MTGDCHVRFRGSAGGKFPCATRYITLNHFNNQSSLLTSINSIDNKYNELKIKLACQLITSLEKSNANLINVTLPLLDIFGKTSFMTNGYT